MGSVFDNVFRKVEPLCVRFVAYLLHLEAEQLKDVTASTDTSSPDWKHTRSW